jgi:hypothetical protein
MKTNWLDSKMKRMGAGIGTVALLFAVGAILPGAVKAGPEAPEPKSVKVVNTPLPVSGSVAVTGTVGINGTPSVNVGTPTVNLATGSTVGLTPGTTVEISNATGVSINNTTTNPVIVQDVDSPGRNPYYQSVTCYNASSNQCQALFPAVPSNMRLVVQYINSSIDTPTPLITGEFDVNGTIFMPILFTQQGNDSAGNKIYIASQPMLYYFEAGQTPYFVMNAQAGGFEFMSGQVTLTGYLVNLTE